MIRLHIDWRWFRRTSDAPLQRWWEEIEWLRVDSQGTTIPFPLLSNGLRLVHNSYTLEFS